MSTNIYILKLQGGKYYIGKSENPMKRYQEHLSGKGSAWTKKYKPIGVEKIIEKASPFDEDKYTKEYMSKYDIENVRGGAYVSMELDEVQEDALIREIRGAKDCCTQCGRKGHFVKDCYAKTDTSGNELVYEDEEDEEEPWESSLHNETKPKTGSCYRCGRSGHWSTGCYAKSDKDGNELSNNDDEDDEDDY